VANQFEIISMVAQKALPRFINNLGFAMQVKNPYQNEFGRTGGKIGANYQIRLPVNFVGGSGPVLTPEDIIENVTPLSITAQLQVSFLAYSSEDLLYMDDHMERYGYPAIETLADKFDRIGLALFQQGYLMQGVPGVSVQQVYTNAGGGQPGQYAVQNLVLNANAALTNQTAPLRDRVMVVNPIQEAGYIGAFTNLFNPADEVTAQWKGAQMKQGLGVNWAVDQNMPIFTTGGSATGVTVNGAGQTGSTLIVAGLNGTINPGDTFTIAGVGAVNPKNYQAITGQLFQATVTSTVTAAGAATISFTPGLVPLAGVGQTATNSPANGAAVIFNNGAASGVQSVQSFLFHPDAFTWACPPLPQVNVSAVSRVVTDKQTGISIRAVHAYDTRMDQMIMRFDVLVGWALQRPNWLIRVAN
jgi:hypothetical protein